MKRKGKAKKHKKKLPIRHWSHSSLVAFLRNPLAWYERYVGEVYDLPRAPSAVVGSAAHKALEHYYSDVDKETSIALGLEYLRGISDDQIDFRVKSRRARSTRRVAMERQYLQAIGFYLEKPPRHKVVGVEVRGVAEVPGLPLPLKAVSDLVVSSRAEPGALDIVDHKFVAAFSPGGGDKTLFALQAIFNYHVVRALYGKPVSRFVVYECKKTKNANGRGQLRRYVYNYRDRADDFALFERLIKDATAELARPRAWLPNPSDMFEGEHSFDLYRLGLVEDE